MEIRRWFRRRIGFKSLKDQMKNTWAAGGTVTLRAHGGPHSGMHHFGSDIFSSRERKEEASKDLRTIIRGTPPDDLEIICSGPDGQEICIARMRRRS